MADFYRVSGSVGTIGDGKGFVSTAAGASFIGKQPIALALYIADGSNSAQNLAGELSVNGAVEGILKAISANTTVLAYQVEPVSSGNISVILEGAVGLGSTDSAVASTIQSMIRGNSPYGNNAVAATGSVVANRGLKLFIHLI